MNVWRPTRILVAVNDSPAALAAGRVAVELARQTGAALRFVHVLTDHELVHALAEVEREGQLGERRARAATSLLRHMEAKAKHGGVDADSVSLEGEPARLVLRHARAWNADLIVIGRSDVHGTGRPYVGTVTRHVLEFSDAPILVVPRQD